MAFWNKPKPVEQPAPAPRPAPMQAAPSPAPQSTKVTLRNPGLREGDPKQLMHGLFNSAMALVSYGPVPVEQLLAQMARTTPVLRQAHKLGTGLFLECETLPAIWAAIDGSRGSAIAVWLSDPSESERFFTTLVQTTDSLPSPLSRDLTMRGQVDSRLAEILDSGDVAPVWEVDEFRHLDDGRGFPGLPASIRRAARAWQRNDAEWFQTSIQDSDGDNVTVFLCRDSMLEIGSANAPVLAYSLGPFPPERPLDGFAALVGRGPYSVHHMAEAVVLSRPVPTGVTTAALDEAAKKMTEDYIAFNNSIRDMKNAPPPERDPRPFWTRIEDRPPGAQPTCPITWPTEGVPYVTLDRIRYNASSDEAAFDTITRDVQQLDAVRGAGFGYSVRDATDSPAFDVPVQFTAVTVNSETGRFVACGYPSAELWGLSPAYDLGAIDGRNVSTFPSQGFHDGLALPSNWVFAGSTKSGALAILDAGVNSVSTDVHGPSGMVAALLFLGGSTGAIVVYQEDGQKRVLTQVDNISGGEPIKFSGDGKWLLVSRWNNATLIEIQTGESVTLDVPNAAWWPLADSTLLSIHRDAEQFIPCLFDLEANAYSKVFPVVSLDVPLLPRHSYLSRPSVSPDGQQMLCQGPTGVTAAHCDTWGTGGRLVVVTLDDGHGEVPLGPFVDQERFGALYERDVCEAQWTARAFAHGVRLHADLQTATVAPIIADHPNLSPKTGDGEHILVLSLNKAIDEAQANPQADPSTWMPFIVAGLVSLAADPEAWARQADWLRGVRDAILNSILDGATTGRAERAWRQFAAAVQAADHGNAGRVDPLTTIWT